MSPIINDKRFSFQISERISTCAACHCKFILPRDSSPSRKYCDKCRIVELTCTRCGTRFKRLRYKARMHLEEGKPVFCKRNCHVPKEQSKCAREDYCTDDDTSISTILTKIFTWDDTSREYARIVTPCSPLQDKFTLHQPLGEEPVQIFPLLPLSEPLEKIKERTNSVEYRRYAAFWA